MVLRVTVTDPRDAMQSAGYPLDEHGKHESINTRPLIAQAVELGFDVEHMGGQRKISLLKSGELPYEVAKEDREAAGKGARLEALMRNMSGFSLGYAKNEEDIRAMLEPLKGSTDTLRLFDANNNIDTLVMALRIAKDMGFKVQAEFVTSQLNDKPLYSKEEVLRFDRIMIANGADSIGWKVFAGDQHPEYIAEITKDRVKQMPEGMEISMHTHTAHDKITENGRPDGKVIPREERLSYRINDAFIAAVDEVDPERDMRVYATNNAFADGLGQPSVDYFVEKYKDTKNDVRGPNWSEETYADYNKGGQVIRNRQEKAFRGSDTLIREHLDGFYDRLRDSDPDHLINMARKSGIKVAKKDIKDVTEELKDIKFYQLKEDFRLAGLPGGGINIAISELEGARMMGENASPPIFNKVDMLEVYIEGIKSIREKVMGGIAQVTPLYDHTDKTEKGIMQSKAIEVLSGMLKSGDGVDARVFVKEMFLSEKDISSLLKYPSSRNSYEMVMTGGYGPTPIEIGQEYQRPIFQNRLNQVVDNYKKVGVLDDDKYRILSSRKDLFFGEVSKIVGKISESFLLGKEQELLSNSIERLSAINESGKYDGILKSLQEEKSTCDEKVSKLGEVVSKKEYIDFFKEGTVAKGSALDKLINDGIEESKPLKRLLPTSKEKKVGAISSIKAPEIDPISSENRRLMVRSSVRAVLPILVANSELVEPNVNKFRRELKEMSKIYRDPTPFEDKGVLAASLLVPEKTRVASQRLDGKDLAKIALEKYEKVQVDPMKKKLMAEEKNQIGLG